MYVCWCCQAGTVKSTQMCALGLGAQVPLLWSSGHRARHTALWCHEGVEHVGLGSISRMRKGVTSQALC